MATVYLARDLKHDRLVAVKMLRPGLAVAIGPERFRRELAVAARLQHPNILPVFDSGEVGSRDSGVGGAAASASDFRPMTLFYVMPFITGESLRQRLDRDRWLPVDEVTRLLTGIAAGLAHAHAHGVVHRDINPENILLQDGVPLLSDFGIARASAETVGEQLTEVGLALGTPIYMSPEQASAGYEAVDGRSDIYSLGCVVYEMLAGGPPFAGATAAAILARHCVDAVPPIRTVRPDIPERVALAVNRALAKRAVDRWRTVGEFVGALRPDTPMPIDSSGSPAPRLSLAILPFENLSSEPDSDYFGDGLAEELTTVFAPICGLNLASQGAAFALKDRKIDPRVAAQRLGVRTVLEGSGARRATGCGSRLPSPMPAPASNSGPTGSTGSSMTSLPCRTNWPAPLPGRWPTGSPNR